MSHQTSIFAVAVLVLCTDLAHGQAQPRAVTRLDYASSSYVVEIAGEAPIQAAALTGGDIIGEVITEASPGGALQKSIAGVSVSPLALRMGPSAGLPAWITQTVTNGTPDPRNVAVTLIDAGGQALGRREFVDTLVTGVAFPELNPVARETGTVTIRLTANAVGYATDRSAGPVPVQVAGARSRVWLRSQFRLELGGDLPTGRVARIEPFAWTMSTNAVTTGDRRQSIAAGAVAIDNLKLQIPVADLAPWQAWMQSFLIDGKNSNADEITGDLYLLDGNLREEILVVELHGIGLVSLTMPTSDAGREQTFGVELYVSRIAFQ